MSEREMLNWAMQVVAVEEMARAKVAVKPEVKVVPTPPVSTAVRYVEDVPIPATIIDEEGRGELKELLVKSGFKEWRLVAFADGRQLYSNTFDWFAGVSQEVEEIAAFQAEDGTYVLHLKDIKFAESLKVWAEPLATVYSVEGKPRLKSVFYKIELTRE